MEPIIPSLPPVKIPHWHELQVLFPQSDETYIRTDPDHLVPGIPEDDYGLWENHDEDLLDKDRMFHPINQEMAPKTDHIKYFAANGLWIVQEVYEFFATLQRGKEIHRSLGKPR